MKGTILTVIAFIGFFNAHALDKKAYYEVFENGTLEKIEAFLKKDLSSAHKGTLLMKKASLVKSPKTKLSLFKEGHKLLEAAIKSNPKNTEYRFLRYVIQSNSPAFLGYKDDMETDLAFIKKNKSTLDKTLLSIVNEYLKKNNL